MGTLVHGASLAAPILDVEYLFVLTYLAQRPANSPATHAVLLFGNDAPSCVSLSMRYLVKAKLKEGTQANLLKKIEDGTLGQGSVAGDEYLHNMREARVDEEGKAQWVETCFCSEPLAEEREYWEEFFELVSVKDAHSRRNCRDLNGSEPWACCNCDCTAALEEQLKSRGKPFLNYLKVSVQEKKKTS